MSLSDKITYDLYKLGYENEEPVEGIDAKDVREAVKIFIPKEEEIFSLLKDNYDKDKGASVIFDFLWTKAKKEFGEKLCQ